MRRRRSVTLITADGEFAGTHGFDGRAGIMRGVGRPGAPFYLTVEVKTSSMAALVRQPGAKFCWLRLSVQMGWERPL